MADNYQIFPDILGEVIVKVRTDLALTDTNSPYYEYGTYLELTKENALSDRFGNTQFPLIWLVWGDGQSNKQNFVKGGNYKVKPLIYIIAKTNPNYTSEQRESLVFTPVLYPILNSLLKYLEYSKYTATFEIQEYEKTNHYKFGFDGQRWRLGYSLDAIEVQFPKIEIQKYC
jgi:hypothetical protein